MGAGPQAQAGIEALGGNTREGAKRIEEAASSIHRSTAALPYAMPDCDRVDRGCFADFARVVGEARQAQINPSLMVYGARGVGKTSMVAAALQVCKLSMWSSWFSRPTCCCGVLYSDKTVQTMCVSNKGCFAA